MSGLRALLMLLLGASVIGMLIGAPPASAAPEDAALTDSAVTVSGRGEFAGLKVTVSQTKNLINQTVTVSWTGGLPTLPLGGFSTNFLQIMQCWGDGPDGPDRTQCQFGGGVAPNLQTGAWTRSRQLTYPFVDPQETLQLPAGSNAFVPFWPVGGDKPTSAVTSGRNDFFNSQITNEVPLARTRGDGTGLEYFEIQTVLQAAGLGCGAPVTTGRATGRTCWLVVVPRGSTEVDGSPKAGTPGAGGFLESSALSQSNWDDRIFFPLEFLPVGQACPLGASERRVVGHELAVEAVSRWQPALCAGGGALYSYTQLPDGVTRNQVLDGSSPGLALMTNPIPPDQAPPQRPLVYAPVGLSGLAIAFNIEHQPSPVAPADKRQLDGQRFTSMKLTPRLVAKLLTQSYRQAVAGYPSVTPEYLKDNPLGLTGDPEFLDLNPEYRDFAFFTTPPDALVELGGSDLTSLLWSWVKADRDASEFIAGTPDAHGMVVNVNNKGLTLPASGFPRNDQSCADVAVGTGVTGRTCTLDIHPFTNDMHDAGRSASRGDSQGRLPDGLGVLKKVDRQLPAQRALLAVVDAATAQRYGLPTAELRNSAGQFVAPSTASLLAGAAAMKPSAVPGVLTPDPSAADPAAYPLTALSYAVTAPAALDAAAGKEYAALLRFVAGPGQQPGVGPGQLPFGMAPLPDTLKAQTTAAAATIEAQAGKTAGGTPTPTPAPKPTSSGAPPGGSKRTSDAGGTTTGARTGTPTPTPGASGQGAGGSAAKSPSVTPQPVAALRRTPSLPAPAVGGLLVAILICGALAATSSPVMHLVGAAVRRRARKGVTPTER
ncbi:MAG: hypothetical protein ACRDSR_14030 [Pseudonocardiaceae bacterium]